MKKLLLSCALMALTATAFAQGTVNFANATTTAGWTFGDQNVKWAGGVNAAANYNSLLIAGANVSSNYAGVAMNFLRAELAYGSGTDWTKFTLAPDSLTTFKGSTSSTAGSWFSKNPVTLTGFVNPASPNLCVLVWDITKAANPLLPEAQLGLFGHSDVFAYAIPAAIDPPDKYLMSNLKSFTVGYIVPEPSTFALLGLGALGMLIFRRK